MVYVLADTLLLHPCLHVISCLNRLTNENKYPCWKCKIGRLSWCRIYNRETTLPNSLGIWTWSLQAALCWQTPEEFNLQQPNCSSADEKRTENPSFQRQLTDSRRYVKSNFWQIQTVLLLWLHLGQSLVQLAWSRGRENSHLLLNDPADTVLVVRKRLESD